MQDKVIPIDGKFGRKVIYSSVEDINESNVVDVLNKAIQIHTLNEQNITYLENYYTGNQPILNRVKEVRPEITNRIVENHAYEIVEFLTSQNYGEPIQYVNRNREESASYEIDKLNAYMFSENKGHYDIEIGRWQNICGTSYRFVFNDVEADLSMDECPFGLDVLRPQEAFVVYSTKAGRRPVMGVWRTVDKDGVNQYNCYTKNLYFEIKDGKITRNGINGIGLIPIIEYPKNERRIGALEIVITMLDAINTIQSNRLDGIEQFVQSFMKFVNCDIDEDTFLSMVKLGAIKIKGEPGNPADVDLISKELNQEQTQVSKDDLYNNILIVEGMPDRQENSGGDTGSAVYLRNGFIFSNLRAEISEHSIQKSEKEFLKVALKILNTKDVLKLKLSDIEVKIMRSHVDNILVKSQALQNQLACGINGEVAIKTSNLYGDPENVWLKSKEVIEAKFGIKSINQNKGMMIEKQSENLQAIE